ncbi:helix-turn-helix domain-containing protein [Amycolatopsis thermoflava]|uniref:helix-turn-helix domain-containing protein n=1 Tax=Amycolatopsis thermoflava TaxID=84480 RepID=UPI0004005FED|nr:helix-turn-helix domain-containing protein [Amycolatopsis thermoflava]
MAEFALYVAVDLPADSLTEDQLDALAEVGAGYHAAWSRSPSASGWLAVHLTLQAEVLRQATDLAFLVVPDLIKRAGLGWHTPVYLEAMTDAEFQDRQEQPPIPPLLSVAEAAAVLGRTEQAVRLQAEKGRYGAFRIGKTWAFPRSLVEAAARPEPAKG